MSLILDFTVISPSHVLVSFCSMASTFECTILYWKNAGSFSSMFMHYFALHVIPTHLFGLSGSKSWIILIGWQVNSIFNYLKLLRKRVSSQCSREVLSTCYVPSLVSLCSLLSERNMVLVVLKFMKFQSCLT